MRYCGRRHRKFSGKLGSGEGCVRAWLYSPALLDLLYSRRPVARRLLAEAQARETPMGRVRVLSAEGLIGFKLQGYINDPTRTRDIEDIRARLRANHSALNMSEVRSYFGMFEREALLDEILAELKR